MKPLVEVVAGLIVRNGRGRMLLAQRPESKDFPFTWECPGGKVDGNESHHEALRRELREELGIEVGRLPEEAIAHREFESIVVRPDRGHVFWSLYLVTEFTGAPTSREGQGFGWFSADTMLTLPLSPGNDWAKHMIFDVMRKA